MTTTTGTSAAETLNGGFGADTITGLAGNDILDGGAGDDVLIGDMEDRPVSLTPFTAYSPEDFSFSSDGRLAFNVFTATLQPNDPVSNQTFVMNPGGGFTLVSANDQGVRASGQVYGAQFRPGTHQVMFWSSASNLVAGDTNGMVDIFLKDIDTGAIVRVSTDSFGVQADGAVISGSPVFSADGNKIAFVSMAGMVADDTNGQPDVYVKDLLTGAVVRASTDSSGVQFALGVGYSQTKLAFSPDGSKLAFETMRALDPNDGGQFTNDIYVKDFATGALTLASTSSLGVAGAGDSRAPVFSPDGTSLLFESAASNLVAGDTNKATDLFIKTLATGAIVRVSTASDGSQLASASTRASFSPDGSKIVFTSYSENFQPAAVSFSNQLYIKDLVTGVVSFATTPDPKPNADYSPDTGFFLPGGQALAFKAGSSIVTRGFADFAAADHLIGGAGDDKLYGGGGDDLLNGGPGVDRMDGGAGNDTVTYVDATTGVRIELGNANGYSQQLNPTDAADILFSIENVVGSNFDDILVGDTGANVLQGGAGSDQIGGNEGIDYLSGGDGDDFIFNGGFSPGPVGTPPREYFSSDGGADVIDGGAGFDYAALAYYGRTGAIVIDNSNSGLVNAVTVGGVAAGTLTSIEALKITGGAADDVLTASRSGYGLFVGGAGDDILRGGGLIDTLQGGVGSDLIAGGEGDDRLYGEAGDDVLIGGEAVVTGRGPDGAFVVSATDTTGFDLYDGGAGVDRAILSYGSLTASLVVDISTLGTTPIIVGGVGRGSLTNIEMVTIVGGLAADQLTGGLLGDNLGGGGGADVLRGGDGDDQLSGGEGDDLLDGGAGVDIAVFSGAPARVDLRITGPQDTGAGLDTLLSIEGASGGAFADRLVGNDERNLLSDLVEGDDELIGLGGDDVLTIVRQHAGSTPVLRGGDGADTLRVSGGQTQARLFGDAGDDVIVLSGGVSVTVDGGAGVDALALSSVRRAVAVTVAAGSASLTGEFTAALTSVERIKFVDGFLAISTEDTAASVYRLYQTMLNRTPDANGLAFWTQQIDLKGSSLKTVANGFIGSREFSGVYGALSNAAFVELMYNNVLHRASDDGRATWINLLNNGGSRAEVAIGFSDSQENIRNLSGAIQGGVWVGDLNAGVAARFYDTVFSRLPDAQGLETWTKALNGGASLASVANGFVASNEFKTTYGNLNNDAFVELMYQNVLHRASDASGKATWVNALNAGSTRADVVVGFSESAEHIRLLAPRIDDGIWVA